MEKNVATKIKYSAGDKVYWLSSSGFKKGIVKQVILTDSIAIHNKQRIKTKEVKYLLWCDKYAEVYMGDQIKEDKIFETYGDMIKYYSTQRIKN